MPEFVKNTNLWKTGLYVISTPGIGYLAAAVVVVSVSLYFQHRSIKAGGDGKTIRVFGNIALGAVLVEAFLDAVNFAVRTFL